MFYLFAIIFFLYVLYLNRISFNNVFPFIFLGFSVLYSGTCFLSVYFDFYKISVVTVLKKNVVNSFLIYSAISIFVFSFFLFFDKKLYQKSRCCKTYRNKNIVFYYMVYLVLYPIALYFSFISNWTTGERVGLIPSLSAYFRNAITVLTIIFFLSENVSKTFKYIFFLLFLVITVKSTQRTSFLIVAIAFVYTLKNSKKAFTCGIIALLALLIVGSVRNGVSLLNIFYPIFGEGIFGSWGTLNSISSIQKYGWVFDNFFYGANGILNFFLKFFLLRLPEVSDWLVLKGIDYYPMGGFYFLSDAILWQPIFGPILFTCLIYFSYRVAYKAFINKPRPKSLLALALLF